RGRLEKRRLVAEFLRAVAPEEVPAAVAFLTARPFPASDPRVLSVRGLPAVAHDAAAPALSLGDVADAFAAVAEASGAGSRRLRADRLADLARRATPIEQEMLARIIGGELRTGVSGGLVLEAIAELAVDAPPEGAPPPPLRDALAAVRRAALFLGDLSAVAALARPGRARAPPP